MKLYFLGTCSGTEPFLDRNHASFALQTGGNLYFFDAGEGCSKTAHLLGLDLMATQCVVISHPHMDHVGGLTNHLWTVRKLMRAYGRTPLFDCLRVYVPCKETWDGVMMILHNTEGNFVSPSYPLEGKTYAAGVLFDDGRVRVTAYPNTHIRCNEGEVRSYSFLIECEGKRIVYSGDLKSYSELDAAIGEGCDAVIGETGHHKIIDVLAYVSKKSIGSFYFTHHGREILNDRAAAEERVASLFEGRAQIAYDGMTVEV